jgi:hypothetical protein
MIATKVPYPQLAKGDPDDLAFRWGLDERVGDELS